MSKIFLSACAIMKNEEKHIGRWLDCVRQVADEIIVVDTGSEDRTVALAQAGGAQVFHFPWVNDFSAAKNFALDQARGKWIVFLDADEFFTEASLPKIRPLLEKADRNWKIAGLVCRWVNFDEDKQMELQGAAVQMRLFRNSRKLRFRGSVHEAIDVSEPYLMVSTRDIEIHHTGYSSGLIQRKLRRNQELLQKRLAESEGKIPLVDMFYLLDCAYGLEDFEEGRRLAETVLGDEGSSRELMANQLARVHSLYISILMRSGCVQNSIEAALDRAMQAFPELADFPLMAGIYHADIGETAGALQELRHGLALYKAAGQRRGSSDMNDLSGNAEVLAEKGRAYMQRLQTQEKNKANKANKGLKISACAIMKNEVANLPQWLKSVKCYADEIIVVDTGSTDGTCELAVAGGAKVYHFDWIDDFAAAKNFALEQATGDWIAFPDADEFFSEQSCGAIRPLLKSLAGRGQIKGIVCQMVNIDRDDHDRHMSVRSHVRLFRNLPEVRYVGRIHEALTSLPESCLQHAPELVLYHTGYSGSIVEAKLRRNLEMLQRRAREEGGVRPGDYRYYMDCSYGVRDYGQAAAWSEKIMNCQELRQDQELQLRAWETWASALVRGERPVAEVLEVMEKARAAWPQVQCFTLMEGVFLHEQRAYLEAENLLRQGLAAEVQEGARRLLPHAYAGLAEIMLLKGRQEEAREMFLQALQVNRFLPKVLQSFVAVLRRAGLPDEDIISLLDMLYQIEDLSFLDNALRSSGGRLALYYARKNGLAAQDLESYILAGRHGAAAEKLRQSLEMVENLAIVQAESIGKRQESGLPSLLGEQGLQSWQRLAEGQEEPCDGRLQALKRLQQEFREGAEAYA